MLSAASPSSRRRTSTCGVVEGDAICSREVQPCWQISSEGKTTSLRIKRGDQLLGRRLGLGRPKQEGTQIQHRRALLGYILDEGSSRLSESGVELSNGLA
jgi:hypothetical protein